MSEQTQVTPRLRSSTLHETRHIQALRGRSISPTVTVMPDIAVPLQLRIRMKAQWTALGALLGAMGTLAQVGVRINVQDGASMHFPDGQVVGSGDSATFFNPPTADPWTMGNGASVSDSLVFGLGQRRLMLQCHLDGTWDGSHWITFTLKGGASFLDPCGFQDQVRVVCENPAATCQG